MSGPSASDVTIMKRLHSLPSTLTISIILKQDFSPPELYESFGIPGAIPDEYECYSFDLAFAKNKDDETKYKEISELYRWDYVRKLELLASGNRPHLRANVSMEAKAIAWFTMMLLGLGCPHHWVLSFEEIVVLDQVASPVSTTLADFGRSLQQAISHDDHMEHVKLAIGIKNLTLSPASSPLKASISFSLEKGQASTKDPHRSWKASPRPPCLVTKWPKSEGAHLIDHKYTHWFGAVIWGLKYAFEGAPEMDGRWFDDLQEALDSLTQKAADKLKIDDDNDYIPLDPLTHFCFDECGMLFNCLGEPCWIWLSGALPMPEAIVSAYETQSDPHQSLREFLTIYPLVYPAMLGSAVKVMVQTFGTEKLKQAYRTLWPLLKTRTSERTGSSDRSSSAHARSSSFSGPRGPPSAPGPPSASRRPPSSDSSPSKPTKRARFDNDASGSGTMGPPAPRSSPASRAGRQQGLEFELDSSPPPWHSDEEQGPTHSTSSSSRFFPYTPDTSLGAPLEGKAIAGPSLEGLSSDDGEPVAAGAASTASAAQNVESSDDWWVKHGLEGATPEQRLDAILLDRIAQVDVAQDEDIEGRKGSWQRAQSLQRTGAIADYEPLQSSYEEHVSALQSVGKEEAFEAMMKERFDVSFWTGLPVLLSRMNLG